MLKSKLYQKLLVAGITGSLLISSGVLAFAATSKSAIAGKFSGGHRGECKGFMQKGNPLESVLKTEVTAGVITQDESDKITAFLKTKEDAQKAARDAEKAKYDAMTDAEKKAAMDAKKVARDAEKAKLAAMTDAEKKVYFEANRPAKVSILSELVTAGILTQDQADKLQAAMPQRPEMGEGRGKGSFVKGTKTTGTSSTVTE